MANKHDSKNDNKHLFYLNELSDYKIASKDPDVRGWPVKDADNRVIGKVDNLLVNKSRERVVYLDVEVDKTIIESDHDPYRSPSSEVHEFINKDGENHLIVPVGLVSLNEDQNFVYTDKVNHKTFAETKRFEKGSSVNREYEVVVLESYGRNKSEYRDNEGNSGDMENRDSGARRTGASFGDTNKNRDTFKDNDHGDSSSRDSSSRDSERISNRDSSLTDSERNSTFRDSNRDSSFRDSDKDTSYRDDERRDDDIDRRDRDSSYRTGSDTGRREDDDSFYDRREFDNSNFRRRR